MNTTTANSTPTGLPAFQQPSFTNNNLNAQTMPLMTPNVSTASPSSSGYTAPITPPAPIVTQQYSPQTGPSTQNYADATYTDKITNAAATPGPVPSTAITSGSNLSTAGAKRSTYETLLQSYLDQQKQFQNQYISSMQQSPEELALAKQLAAQKTQGALNQEQALNSGETSSFAGGEAQRVARTDAIKQAGIAAQLDVMQNARENKVKQLEFLINSGDKSFKTQLEMQKLQTEVSGIDKQAQDTFFNLAQTNPTVDVTYDPTKTALENLKEIRSKIGSTQETNKFGTPQQLTDNERSLLTSFVSQPQVKNYAEILTKANSVNNILDKKLGGPGDLAIVYEFMKGLDPSSVVRETEYATAAKSGNIFAGMYTRFNGYLKPEGGFLPENVKQSFKSIVDSKLQEQQASYNQIKSDYQAIAQRSGLNPENVVINYDKTQRYQNKPITATEEQYAAAMKKIDPETNKPFTREGVDKYLSKRNFSSVGSDTNQATSQNLMGDLGNMQGLMGQMAPADYSSTDFGNMNGLMKPTPQLQLKIEIPKTSKLSFINNNPANLRFAGQIGASKGEGGFAKFNSPQEGLNALVDQIKLDAGRGHTLSTFINKFAPPTENDTKLYIQQAMQTLGVSKDTPISQIPVNKLAKFMAMKESSTKVN